MVHKRDRKTVDRRWLIGVRDAMTTRLMFTPLAHEKRALTAHLKTIEKALRKEADEMEA